MSRISIFYKASVKSVIKKTLKSHLVDYARETILYSNTYSDDARWQAYRFYLGESIEKGFYILDDKCQFP